MDVSTDGSVSHRVPVLDGRFYNSWRSEMLSIFKMYNLCKYVETPYVPPFNPLHPTMDEELDLLRNLRTVNLIIRGLPDDLLDLVTSSIQNVMLVESLGYNLLSVSRLGDFGFNVLFTKV